MDELCWYCGEFHTVPDDKVGKCDFCGVVIDRTIYKPQNEEEKMGKLAERAREKSPYIRLDIGEETPELVFKSWKETTDNFGNDTFRYFFELETETGLVTKQMDNRSQSFAEAMDKIAFGEKVILKREPKLDHEGEPLENKSIWTVRKVE